MWPVVSRSLVVPSFWDDFPDVMDVAFRSPFENNFFHNLLGTTNKDLYLVKIHVGNYTNEDIKLHVKGDILQVTGTHIHNSKYGTDRSEFTREFELPKEVLRDSLRHYVTADGVLVIEGKKHIDVRYPFQDKSDKDNFKVIVDVKGFKPEEVNVSLHERNIIIEASHQSEKESSSRRTEEVRSFRKVVQLPHDVDESTFSLTRQKDDYVVIQAKRDPKKFLEGAKKLEIKQE